MLSHHTSQNDADRMLRRLAEERGVDLAGLSPEIMSLMRELAEGYLDGKRVAIALHIGDSGIQPHQE